MAAGPRSPERRRPRPGSLERPVNGRLYRAAWVFVGLPLLLLAFSVARPAALQPSSLPPAFDRDTAAGLARELAFRFPNRAPGSPGAGGAAAWVTRRLAPYGYAVRRDVFTARVPGRGGVRLVDLVASRAGASPQRWIVVMAHRDDGGAGSGLDDNASGTAALLELARTYAPAAGAPRAALPYSLVFLSTDGGTVGALGAAHFASEPATLENAVAVINLDAIGGSGVPRLELAGDTARSPAPGLAETVREMLARETGAEPARPSGLRQLIDLAFPFSAYEQAPFVSNGIPAVTITTSGDRPPGAREPLQDQLHAVRLGQIGRAAEDTINAMEQGVALAQGPASYVFLGQRLLRGWAIELVLVGALLPFLAAAVDLFARCRRRGIAVAPALRSYRSRLGFWCWVGLVFGLLALAGVWGRGGGRPPTLDGVRWPTAGLAGLAALAAVGWAVARERLLPRRRTSSEELLAGYAAGLLALSVVALLVAATDPFALLFLLPCLHLWLWLPQVHSRGAAVRILVLAAGLAGPGLLLWSFAVRFGLGWDAPWYVVQLFTVGYARLPLLVIALAWLAALGQLVALSAGRYAPYPSERERPPRGPIRETVRRIVLAQRRRRRVLEPARRGDG